MIDINDIVQCKNCMLYFDIKENKIIKEKDLIEENIDVKDIKTSMCKKCVQYISWENDYYNFNS